MHKTLTEHALSCASWQQAQAVIDHLFSKSLILRAEILPVQKGADQVMVVIENLEDDIEAVTHELAAFFGHSNFNFQQMSR
jgi:hypothetical protein